MFSPAVRVQLIGIPWPMICSTPGLPVLHYVLGSLLKPMSIGSVMPSNDLILRHPLYLLLSIFPSIRVFFQSVDSASSGQTMGDLASASVLPMNFQDWFPLGLTGLNSTVQGTLKSLLQHQSSKASIFRLSVFFMVQLSHLYITTGKTTALTRWIVIGKVMSLLFNMLSRFVIAFLPRSLFSINFMVAVTVYSDFGALENKVCHYFQIQR